ncbi:MAG TPA: FAD-dependent oxidoreductase, partial [Abditibacteriaceae bacterium]|nr:FAD-dependent oxidoreductase [Abditibacteriaceae bacterium]
MWPVFSTQGSSTRMTSSLLVRSSSSHLISHSCASRRARHSRKVFQVVALAALAAFVLWHGLATPRALAQGEIKGQFAAIPAADSYDVLVVGGTPSGIAAALAAGRRGARVLLVESRPRLGGDVVYAMLNQLDVPIRP